MSVSNRLFITVCLPKRKRTVHGLIAAALFLVALSYSLLPSTDVSVEFPSFQSFTPEIPSPNLTKLLSTYIKPRKEKRVNCAAIIDGDVVEIENAVRLSNDLQVTENEITPQEYMHLSSNCKRFLDERGYIMNPLSFEELRFPIAFSILVHTDMEMAERLFRAIYRPQNYYCIHVDAKSEEIYAAFRKIVSCFSNVLLAKKRLHVVWGSFSVLQADLVCMETLWPIRRWKYFINLTGQEFPLKSNSDLVKILEALDGANDVHATLSETYKERRWRYRSHVPPTWFMPVKGSVHVTISRAFADYVLHNDTAIEILKWVRRLEFFQDEAFFSTLNHNPQLGIPGSYKGHAEHHALKKPFLSRYKIWNTTDDYFCYANRWMRYICILTTGDLPIMIRSVQLFANKFFLNEDRIVISCLEEWLYNSTRDSFLNIRHLDVSYYRNLDFVLNQIKAH
ncbi:hypothetical protein BsWGS_12698 [Bradybaena similaris]